MQIVSHEIPLLVSSSHTMQYSPINDYETQWGKFGITKSETIQIFCLSLSTLINYLFTLIHENTVVRVQLHSKTFYAIPKGIFKNPMDIFLLLFVHPSTSVDIF